MDELLNQFGLSPEETLVYKTLLKLGGAKVSEIASTLNFKRTSTQEYIRSLGEKGFINSTKFGNKYLYQAEDPDKFRQIINEREFVVDRLVNDLKNKTVDTEWQVRSLTKLEVNQQSKKAQKKGVTAEEFGKAIIGGRVVGVKTIFLWGEDKDLPAIEIISEELAELHLELIKATK